MNELNKKTTLPIHGVRRSFFTYINGKRTLVNQDINSGDIIWVLDPLTERWYVEECIEVIGDEFIKHTNNNETVTVKDILDHKEIGCISDLLYCYKQVS